MSFNPIDRRSFLGVASGALLCTIGGQKVYNDQEADVEQLAKGVTVPPKVQAAQSNPALIRASTTSHVLSGGTLSSIVPCASISLPFKFLASV